MTIQVILPEAHPGRMIECHAQHPERIESRCRPGVLPVPLFGNAVAEKVETDGFCP